MLGVLAAIFLGVNDFYWSRLPSSHPPALSVRVCVQLKLEPIVYLSFSLVSKQHAQSLPQVQDILRPCILHVKLLLGKKPFALTAVSNTFH